MATISRERVPGRGSDYKPRDLAEAQDWQVLTGRIRTLSQEVVTLQQQVTGLLQQVRQPIWTVVAQSTNYEFPAAFIRVELDATAANRVATLPLSANLQGQLVNVVKSDASANTVTATPSGSDSFFGTAGYNVLTARWNSIVLIGVPSGWSILSRSV